MKKTIIMICLLTLSISAKASECTINLIDTDRTTFSSDDIHGLKTALKKKNYSLTKSNEEKTEFSAKLIDISGRYNKRDNGYRLILKNNNTGSVMLLESNDKELYKSESIRNNFLTKKVMEKSQTRNLLLKKIPTCK